MVSRYAKQTTDNRNNNEEDNQVKEDKNRIRQTVSCAFDPAQKSFLRRRDFCFAHDIPLICFLNPTPHHRAYQAHPYYQSGSLPVIDVSNKRIFLASGEYAFGLLSLNLD